MQIPNFKTEEGSILYKNTVGKLISPRVTEVLLNHTKSQLENKSLDSHVETVLDLGCGPGTLCIPLAEAYPNLRITAVDFSDAMVALAKEKADERGLQNIEFRTMDASNIDFEPASFHLVLCNLAFPFFPRPHDSMRELFPIVKPGGMAYFTVPGRNTWSEFFEVAEAALGSMMKMAKPFLSKFNQAEVLPEALSEAGFEGLSETRTLLPFQFANGQQALDFFNQLFHMLDYAPPGIKDDVAAIVDEKNPDGFTMHYEAVLISAQRPAR